MFSPIVNNVIEREKLPVVTHETVDSFLDSHNETILFISGDARRFPEANDVAVILPEIIKAFNGRLNAAIVHSDSEREIQKRFRFNKFPALIFCRGRGYLGAIPKVLDWTDYIVEISEILSRDVTDIPAFQLPDGCRTAVEAATNATETVQGN